jgi:autotransporter-associated beta strand protein
VLHWDRWFVILLMTAGLPVLPVSAQTFRSEGPAPSQGDWETIQSRDVPGVGEGTVSGAVQAVLPDPNNPNRIFIGSTTGGVWRTADNGATWTPLTDKAASLSIGSLAFDPANTNIIVAGVGATSNGSVGSFQAGRLTGLLYTDNGGATWTAIDRGLAGKSIVGVAVRGDLMLAAAAFPNNLVRGGGGLFISEAGVDFTPVNGIPLDKPVTALAADGASSTTFYASVSGAGLYRSTNSGRDWALVSVTGISTAHDLRVMTGKAAGSLVVAAYRDGKVTGIALTKDAGQTWSALPVPTPNTGQAQTNLALAIDPSDPDVVYFGGAASAQDRNWTLAGYKLVAGQDGQPGTVTPITLEGTSDFSAPHADARAFVFDQNGRMLMGGDGGVYTLSSSDSGLSWSGLNSSQLSLREANAIAYDAISKRIVVAAQDTGAAIQNGSRTAGYFPVQGADGTNAVVNDRTLKAQGLSAVYTSTQGLGGLSRQTFDASGRLIGTQFFNVGPTGANRLNFEADDYAVDEEEKDDQNSQASLPHFSQMALNKVDPTRIAFGTNYVYTTTDPGAKGTTMALLNRGEAGSQIGAVRTVAFGTLDNPDAVLAASLFQIDKANAEGRIYLSLSNKGGTLEQLTNYPSSTLTPTSVVFDARYVNYFYVANGGTLQGTANRGDVFKDLTPKLTPLGIERPLALDFISTNGVNALVVGGLRTDETKQSPLAVVEASSTGALIDASWRAFGKELPNTMVSALAFSNDADVLVASMWGRGMWTLYDVTSNFASAKELQFGLADNDSTPDPTLLTNGDYASRPLVKYGTGTLTIDAPASYSGGTTIKDGTLVLTGSGTLGSAAAATTIEAGLLDLGGTTQVQNGGLSLVTGVVQNGVFRSAGPFAVQDGTISAALAGGGSLTKSGQGTVVLSGINTYTGSTSVTAGILRVNGSIAASSGVTVGAEGVLAGSGTVSATVVNGFVGPNNPGGVLTINTSYTQNPGSTYEVVTTAGGLSDRLQVNGPATLAGTVAAFPTAGAYGRGKTFTILTATSIAGSYGGATSSYAFLQPTLSYDATDVFLTLTPGGFARGAATPNQAAVGAVLDRSVATASGDFLDVIDAFALMTPSQAQAGFQAISGQSYSGFGTLGVQTAQLFMNFFAQQAGGAQPAGGNQATGGGRVALVEACDVACDLTAAPRWSAWGGALGGLGTIAGNADANGLTFNIGGFAAGLDRRFDGGFLAGMAAGFTSATQYTQNIPGQGTANTVQFALYGEYSSGSFYLDALAGYARSNSQMTRPIFVTGLAARTALGQTSTDQFFGQIEAGYRIALGGPLDAFVTPFARLQGSTASQAGFTETGAGSLNLAVAGQTTNSLRSVLGFQAGAAADLGWRDKIGLVLRLGWSHEYADTARPVNASFAGAPASPFTVYGAATPRDGAILGLGASTAIGNATSVYLRYDGELAGGTTSHVLSAGVRLVW